MQSIKVELSEQLQSIEIHTLADLHMGDKHCDNKLIQERIRLIQDTENAYCILNGDLMNNATKTSISDSYAEQLTPMQQIGQAVYLLTPIKDKIIAIQSGNHESRTYKKEGIDLTEIMARELGLGDKYSSTGSLIFVRFGWNEKRKRKQWYTLYAIHGSGGGRKEGAKAIRLADMASIVDADIYIHSHTHLPMIMKQGFFRVDTSNSTTNFVNKLFVNTSAMLNYGGYGEAYEFKPSSKDTPVIYMSGTNKHFTAKL
ncbi:metallophosphoesterase [Anaerocolumna chitinilytica]|uniref:metallophosphoesterase n=1 Tax=Anaerocolumna chitinilytica TaxID=1727145 RepID=UPI001624F12F|nr:metallophosphoesterase [Anaerocolumna chitinilytica]